MTRTMTPAPTLQPRVQHQPVGARRAATAATVLLAGLIVFQVALAAGAPWGSAAWGGTHRSLPVGLRVATAVPIAIYAAAACILLRRAGYAVTWVSTAVARRGAWIVTAVMALSALMNLASDSEWERFLMAPIAAVLAALSAGVAHTGR